MSRRFVCNFPSFPSKEIFINSSFLVTSVLISVKYYLCMLGFRKRVSIVLKNVNYY